MLAPASLPSPDLPLALSRHACTACARHALLPCGPAASLPSLPRVKLRRLNLFVSWKGQQLRSWGGHAKGASQPASQACRCRRRRRQRCKGSTAGDGQAPGGPPACPRARPCAACWQPVSHGGWDQLGGRGMCVRGSHTRSQHVARAIAAAPVGSRALHGERPASLPGTSAVLNQTLWGGGSPAGGLCRKFGRGANNSSP